MPDPKKAAKKPKDLADYILKGRPLDEALAKTLKKRGKP
jgi:hypothetical protein